MTIRHFPHLFLLSGLLICAFSRQATADEISLTLSNSSLLSTSGGDVIFQGTLTNNSGLDLNASDFFFNFFGYDSLAVTPSQILGVASDFLIPNGTTSATVDLFDVLLGSVANGANFQLQVQLEDINSNLSAIQTVTVSTSAVSPVPEPAAMLLAGTGMAGMLLLRRYNRRRRNS